MGIDPVKILKAAFTEESHIDLRKNPINVRLEDDILFIEGTVDGIAAKKRSLFKAMGLDGVSGVVDRLTVRASSKMTDAEIRDHLYDAITEEPTLDETCIKAEVNDGKIDLEGTVGSLSHKRLAGVLAWWIPGSIDVINSLEVSPPQEDSDEEVTDALRLVLEKDHLVDASSITVSTMNWVATLGGTASSEAQRNAAEDDAWYLWGVNEVLNKIRVL